MSSLSPAQRLRTKTSDLTDLFRSGSSLGTRSGSQVQLASALSDQEASTTSSKKKTSRIPFLGRSRKKSDASSTPPASQAMDCPSPQVLQSFEAVVPAEHMSEEFNHHGGRPSTSKSRGKPASSTPQQSQPSLGSKLAAHFAQSRSRKRKSLPPPPENGNGSAISNTLSPPTSNSRTASFESASSGTTRPPTPKPIITVSQSQEGLRRDFEGLFTLPQSNRRVTSPIPPSSKGMQASDEPGNKLPVSQSKSEKRQIDTELGASPLVGYEELTLSGQQSGSTTSRPKRSKQTESSSKVVDSAANLSPDTITPKAQKRLSAPSLLPVHSEPIPGVAPASPISPISSTRVRPAQPGRPPSIPLPPPPKSPPPIPRPATASGSTTPFPSTVKATTTPVARNESGNNSAYPGRRPRAHTVAASISTTRDLSGPTSKGNDDSTTKASSKGPPQTNRSNASEANPSAPQKTPDVPEPVSPLPAPRKSSVNPPLPPPQILAEPIPNFNIDTATPEELKTALIARNKQYDELANYLLSVTAAHVAERAALEKKIASMDRDAARRDKEIKGLTWLVMNNRGPSYPALGLDNSSTGSNGSRSSALSNANVNRSDSPASSKISLRRFHYVHAHTDESGTESHITSGNESYRGSGGSENESSSSYLRARRIRRIIAASGATDGIALSSRRVSSARSSLLSTEISASDSATSTTAVSSYQSSKRSSTSSFTSTPVTPSLAPGTTSVDPSTVVSPLTSIPEAPTPPPRDPLGSVMPVPIRRTSSSKQGHDTKDDKRASRASAATPNPSAPSPIATTTITYTASLRKGRPPSIAQVLEKSAPSTPTLPAQQPSNLPTTATTPIDDVLEKLRPFAHSK
ncbi:hypothetical protein AX16_002959 [Volvariella volvacea WC 439]|nr:hypothetical protein AX16_002959 [Volvariella volvacea WC 439]